MSSAQGKSSMHAQAAEQSRGEEKEDGRAKCMLSISQATSRGAEQNKDKQRTSGAEEREDREIG